MAQCPLIVRLIWIFTCTSLTRINCMSSCQKHWVGCWSAGLTEAELLPLSDAEWGVKAPNTALIAHVAVLTEPEPPLLSAAQWGVRVLQLSTLLKVPCTDYPCTGHQALYKH